MRAGGPGPTFDNIVVDVDSDGDGIDGRLSNRLLDIRDPYVGYAFHERTRHFCYLTLSGQELTTCGSRLDSGGGGPPLNNPAPLAPMVPPLALVFTRYFLGLSILVEHARCRRVGCVSVCM